MNLAREPLPAGPEKARVTMVAAAVMRPLVLLPVLLAAFALYWASSFSLELRGATTYFGADSFDYSGLASGNFNRRALQLHPVTVVLALGWMKLFSPLAAWIAPAVILKAFFAFIGALGVCAAALAFSAFMERRHALLWAAIYASSMGVWYFASIEESKIVSATLAAIYIALYAHLRNRWSTKGAVALTAALLAACLNEITAAFLVAIPAVDAFIKHRFALRAYGWIALHALMAPLALAVIEIGIGEEIGTDAHHEEGGNLVEMFFLYFARNTYDLETLLDFLKRWIFFNIAAPEAQLHYAIEELRYGGDFQPVLSLYLSSPLSAALTAAFAVMLFACFRPRGRDAGADAITGLLLALGAYAFVRMTFFFLFIPNECLLFSPGASLAHLLLLAIPFMASRFAYKGALLGTAAMLLLVTNAIFMFTASAVPLQGQ